MQSLTQRLRSLARAEHDDLTVGDEAADEIDRLTRVAKEKADLLKAAYDQIDKLKGAK